MLTLLPTDAALSEVHLWWMRSVCLVCALSCAWRLALGGRFRMTLTDWLVAACWVYGALNVYVVSHTPCATKFAVASLCFASYLSVRLLLGGGAGLRRVHLAVLPALCLLAGLYEVGLSLLQLAGYAHSRHFLYALTGTFCNPGPLAGFLAVMASVGLAAGLRGRSRWFLILSLPLLALLPVAGSRSALLAVGVSVCLLCRDYLRRHWKWACAVAVVLVVVGYCSRRGSADSRFFMAVAAVEHLSVRAAGEPSLWLTGVGVGGYLHHLAEGMAAYFGAHPASEFVKTVGVPDQSFCEPVRIFVEQGAVGLVLFIAAVVSGMVALWRRCSPLFYGILAFAVFSCFSYPLSSPSFCVLLAVFLAVGSALQAESPKRPAPCPVSETADGGGVSGKQPEAAHCAWRRLRLIPTVMAVCAVCVLPLATFPVRVRANMEYARFAGIQSAAFVTDCYDLWPNLCENQQFLFNFATLLRRQGRYNDSNAMLREGVKISADPIFHVLMGRNYEDMSLYPQADSAYAHAFLMQPNRAYPLYRQMKLCLRAGDTARAERMARAVRDFVPKVENSATAEMRAEAEALLRDLGRRRE